MGFCPKVGGVTGWLFADAVDGDKSGCGGLPGERMKGTAAAYRPIFGFGGILGALECALMGAGGDGVMFQGLLDGMCEAWYML